MLSIDLAAARPVLFDFDGTLADSYPAITASVNHVRAARGLEPLAVAEVRRHVGRGPEYLLRHTVPGTDPAIAVPMYRAHHPSVLLDGTTLLQGAFEVVTGLHRAGILLAVCSNKPVIFTHALLAHLKLASCFQVVLGPEDVPRHKPAPDMLLLALHRLSISAADALYIGDMTVDVEAARAAGVRVWVVPTGSDSIAELRSMNPDRVIAALDELLELLR